MKTSEYLDCCELCTFHFYLVSFFFFQLNGSKIRGVQNISDARIEQWQIYGQPNTLWIFKKGSFWIRVGQLYNYASKNQKNSIQNSMIQSI